MQECIYVHVQWNPLFKNPDPSINRAHFAVPNTLFVYIITPEMRDPSSIPRVSRLERGSYVLVHRRVCMYMCGIGLNQIGLPP